MYFHFMKIMDFDYLYMFLHTLSKIAIELRYAEHGRKLFLSKRLQFNSKYSKWGKHKRLKLRNKFYWFYFYTKESQTIYPPFHV